MKLLALLAMLLLAGCTADDASGPDDGGDAPGDDPTDGSDDPGEPQPTEASDTTHLLFITGFTYSDADLTIDLGDTVQWTNQDPQAHTVTADEGAFDSGTIPQSGAYAFTFLEPGTYTYHCTFHPSMTGTITVRDSTE